jgi:hypothetical protein
MDEKRLEQHQRHLLGQTTLMELEFRTDHDHGSPGIIDAFPEEILAEPPPLAPEHGRKRAEKLPLCRDSNAVAPVVSAPA